MYVFFDIEKCNRFDEASICQIGIIALTDDGALEKKNFLIKPRAQFNLHKIKKNPITISVTKDDVKDKPDFKTLYSELEVYFNASNVLAGYAVENDVRMLLAACRRNRKPMFSFSFFDVQTLYAIEKKDAKEYSLESVAKEYGVEFTAHDALQDAEATYLIYKGILDKRGKSFEELVNDFKFSLGFVDSQKIIPLYVPVFESLKASQSVDPMTKAAKKLLLSEFIKNQTVESSGFFAGKRVCFTEALEFPDIAKSRTLMTALNRSGGKYTREATACNIFVTSDEDTKTSLRKQIIENRNRVREKVTVLTESSFLELLDAPLPDSDIFNDRDTLIRLKSEKIKQGAYEKYKKLNDKYYRDSKN